LLVNYYSSVGSSESSSASLKSQANYSYKYS
jgi:hypothetical protein